MNKITSKLFTQEQQAVLDELKERRERHKAAVSPLQERVLEALSGGVLGYDELVSAVNPAPEELECPQFGPYGWVRQEPTFKVALRILAEAGYVAGYNGFWMISALERHTRALQGLSETGTSSMSEKMLMTVSKINVRIVDHDGGDFVDIPLLQLLSNYHDHTSWQCITEVDLKPRRIVVCLNNSLKGFEATE